MDGPGGAVMTPNEKLLFGSEALGRWRPAEQMWEEPRVEPSATPPELTLIECETCGFRFRDDRDTCPACAGRIYQRRNAHGRFSAGSKTA